MANLGWHPLNASERQQYWNGFAAAVSFLRSVRLEGYSDLERAEQMARRFQNDIQARFEPGTVDFAALAREIGTGAAILQHSPKDGFGQGPSQTAAAIPKFSMWWRRTSEAPTR